MYAEHAAWHDEANALQLRGDDNAAMRCSLLLP